MRLIHGLFLAAAVLSAGACGKQAKKAEAPAGASAPAAPAGAVTPAETGAAPTAIAPQAPPAPTAAEGAHSSNLAPSVMAGAELGQHAAGGGMATGLAGHEPDKTASGIGAPATGSAPPVLAPDKLKAAFASLQLTANAGGQVKNACDEYVTPQVAAAELGGSVGRATLITLGGGPGQPSCYGMTGTVFYLLKAEGEGFKPIFTASGSLAVMASAHNGVKDIAVGGPGFEFPVYHWDGAKYVEGRKIKDTEFPASLN